ncbi:MAG TPA: hypothetical protein VJO53_09375 [Candidatus Acidoferrales bacterium]|nr:hypothetical protein [Candidatus Acidoferrales bacterium]
MRYRHLTLLAACLLSAGAATTALAQNSSSASSGDAAAPPSQAAQPAAKKVWTNDDVNTLRDESVISTVGASSTRPAKPAANPKGQNTKSYQDQIAKLQAQIPLLDSQIAELRAAIEGKPTGDSKTSKRPRGVKADEWPAEMEQLQKKRADILARISALEDQARHSGAPANTLP